LVVYPESNRNFESNKILGGVGAILTAIGSLVLFNGSVGIVGILGLILVLISMRGLADEYKHYSIFHSALIGFILGIIGIFIAIIVFAAFAFLSGFIFVHPVIGILGIVGAVIGWGLMFLFFLLSGVFFRHAFYHLAYESRINLLRTGGLLLLIGGILTVIFVGFFLLFVGWIIIAVGLFSLQLPMQPTPAYTPPTTARPTASGQFKYCPNCGSENRPEATFCTHCGRRINGTRP
jgi:uncharacterized membrane protein